MSANFSQISNGAKLAEASAGSKVTPTGCWLMAPACSSLKSNCRSIFKLSRGQDVSSGRPTAAAVSGVALNFFFGLGIGGRRTGGLIRGSWPFPGPDGTCFTEGDRLPNRSCGPEVSAGVAAFWPTTFYISFVWVATFESTLAEPPIEQAFTINTGMTL